MSAIIISSDMAIKVFRMASWSMRSRGNPVYSEKYQLAKEIREYFKVKLKGVQNGPTANRDGGSG